MYNTANKLNERELDRNATIVFIFNFQDGNILGVTLLKLRLLLPLTIARPGLNLTGSQKVKVNLF